MDKPKCLMCNKEFLATKNKLYCSSNCNHKAYRQRNKELIKTTNKEKYATDPGYREKVQNAIKKYRNKRKTDSTYKDEIRFDGNRKKVLERDDHTCQICGSKEMLDIHHIDKSGQTDKPNNDMSNLITLCKPCHQDQHKKDKPSNGKVINCLHCGKETFALKKEIGRKKYCSVECADKAKIGVYKSAYFIPCPVCGKEYRTTAHLVSIGRGKYCSQECSRSLKRKTVETTCQYCQKPFNTIPAILRSGKGKYCSRDCKDKSMIKVRVP